jgi:agmatinase
MAAHGMRSHFMAEVEADGMDAVIERAVDEALDGPKHLYVSLDIDVLDPAYAPGTGTPEPGGLTTRELFLLLRRLAHEVGLVGAEVVEVCPAHDSGYTTALNADRAIMEMITGMAMRKQGIVGRHHLDVRARGNRERR